MLSDLIDVVSNLNLRCTWRNGELYIELDSAAVEAPINTGDEAHAEERAAA